MVKFWLHSVRNHCKEAWFFYSMVVIIALLFFVSVQISDVMGQTKWIKHLINPVLDEKTGPLNEWNVSYHDVMLDGNTFKMWFSGWSNDHLRIGYATSPDGINWTKHPSTVLDIGAPGEWDSENVYCPSVFFDGTIYKMWYCTWGGGSQGRIGLATSPDGINWTKHLANPILGLGPAGSWDSDGVGWPDVIFDGNTYKMWYEGGNLQGSNIGYATSPDGISWTKHPSNPVFKVGQPGSFDDTTVGSPCVIFNGVNYQIWYGAWDGSKDRTGYATSSDGIDWTKHPNNPVLDVGNAESWENFGAVGPRVIFDGKKYRMWYMGEELKGTYYFHRIGYANTPPPHDFRFAVLPKSLEQVPILANIAPTVEVLNGGLNDEFSVTVICQVDSQGIMVYSDTQTIDTLTSLATRQVAFNNWRTYTASSGTVSFYTHLANDDDLANDTLRTTIEISNMVDGFEFGMEKWQSDNKWVAFASAHTGKFCLKSSQANYENNVDSWAEYKHSFNLSKLNAAHISYWIRHYIETDRDFGYVEASGDGGNTWQQLGNPYTGNQGAWKEDARSLTAFCGPGFTDVRIRFRFKSDSTTVRPGWFIDDINIYPYEVQTAVASEESKQIPNEFVLYDNYPNPFNPKTTISYSIAQSGFVTLKIYNMLGREIETLVSEFQHAGKYNFGFDASQLSSGVYFYQLQVGNGFSNTKKLLLIK